MNTDELLTAFRSEVPIPDEATAQRIYGRTIRERRPLPRKRLVLALAAAAICAAVPAIVLTGVVGRGSGTARVRGMDRGYHYQSEKFTGSDHAVTSIALTFRATIADATLRLQVFRSGSSQVPPPGSADSHIVFQEQVPMTDLGSALPDGTLSTWSGTLTPGDWDGGCDEALYRVESTVFPAGSSTPWGGGYTAWFRCSGPTVDPTHPFPN